MEDKIFRLAIIVSFLLHLVFFVRFYIHKNDVEILKTNDEMNYTLKSESPLPKPPSAEILVQKIESIAPSEMQIKTGVPQNIIQNEGIFGKASGIGDNFKMYERQPERLKGLKVTREVSMPMLKSEKINTPAYVTYYQIVRDRIRERAYNNYTRLSVGEVYLTFIIKADGTLGDLQIIESKSTANDFLREIGQKSISEAAPFPAFPSDLNYPELTFNVAISFQYHEE
jgi:hypothetical protein